MESTLSVAAFATREKAKTRIAQYNASVTEHWKEATCRGSLPSFARELFPNECEGISHCEH